MAEQIVQRKRAVSSEWRHHPDCPDIRDTIQYLMAIEEGQDWEDTSGKEPATTLSTKLDMESAASILQGRVPGFGTTLAALAPAAAPSFIAPVLPAAGTSSDGPPATEVSAAVPPPAAVPPLPLPAPLLPAPTTAPLPASTAAPLPAPTAAPGAAPDGLDLMLTNMRNNAAAAAPKARATPKGKAKAARKLKGRPKGKAKAAPKAKAKAKASPAKPAGLILRCAKCRGSKRGCNDTARGNLGCRNPLFCGKCGHPSNGFLNVFCLFGRVVLPTSNPRVA